MGNEFNETVEGGKAYVQKKASELRGAAQEKAAEMREHAENIWSDAQDHVRTFQDETEDYIRENPTKSVLYALGIGFVLGMVFRRR